MSQQSEIRQHPSFLAPQPRRVVAVQFKVGTQEMTPGKERVPFVLGVLILAVENGVRAKLPVLVTRFATGLCLSLTG